MPAALAVTMCEAPPPSDQPVNWYVVDPSVCGEDADSEFNEPLMTSRVNGAVAVVAFTPSSRPVGAVANERITVFGWSSRVVDAVAPWASVAVSVSSRCAGYS